MQKIRIFNVKWTFKDKNFQQAHHLKILNIKKYILGKFQCILLINSLFDDVLFIYLFFDTTLTYFLSPHNPFFLCDKCGVVISKVHYESIIFLEFIQFFNVDFH